MALWVSRFYDRFYGNNFSFSLCSLPKIFDANNDRGTAVKHQIEPPISAVALRFHPIAWSGDMCMRVEAFGCDGKYNNGGCYVYTVLHCVYIV